MKTFLLLLFTLAVNMHYGQNVGIGTNIPNPNAILDIKSGNKGLLIPRMDSAVRKLIPNTKGLLVYDTTTNSLWHNDGTRWLDYHNISKGTTAGDMLYWNGSSWGLIPKGVPDQILRMNYSGLPEWQYPATLSINDASVTEGNSGFVNMSFTVTKNAVTDRTVTVQYSTANGTATAPGDYTTATGTLTFTPAETTKTITVMVNGDVLEEASETFFVNLSSAVNATLTDSVGVGTIINDDNAPGIAISNASLTEGNSGTTFMTFTVSLNSTSTQVVTVDYNTSGITATSGIDFTAVSGTLSFAAGVTSQIINVPIIGDLFNEPNETFAVNLINPINGYIISSLGTGTITNDDPVPSMSINDVSITEGNSGYKNLTFTVTLSNPSYRTVSVNFATANGTATSGGTADYVATNGTLSFTSGVITQTISVQIIGDIIIEPNETFFVNLSGASNGTIADGQGIGTIINDD